MNTTFQYTSLLLLILILGIVTSATAQEVSKDDSATFVGTLFRSDTNQPIANAKIALLDEKKSEKKNNSKNVVSDSDGKFSFGPMPAGKYTLSIQVIYDRAEDVPCRFLLGKLKGEKSSNLLVISEEGKKIYRVFVEGFSIKSGKNVTKDYDLVCISAFGN